MRLQVVSFCPPLCLELYFLVKPNGDDGYLYGIKSYLTNGPAEGIAHEGVDNSNFSRYVNRRVPFSKNEIMLNTTGYNKNMIIRYAENDESTPETRQRGLETLRSFFMDPRYSTYPPKNLVVEDLTDEDNYTTKRNYQF